MVALRRRGKIPEMLQKVFAGNQVTSRKDLAKDDSKILEIVPGSLTFLGNSNKTMKRTIQYFSCDDSFLKVDDISICVYFSREKGSEEDSFFLFEHEH